MPRTCRHSAGCTPPLPPVSRALQGHDCGLPTRQPPASGRRHEPPGRREIAPGGQVCHRPQKHGAGRGNRAMSRAAQPVPPRMPSSTGGYGTFMPAGATGRAPPAPGGAGYCRPYAECAARAPRSADPAPVVPRAARTVRYTASTNVNCKFRAESVQRTSVINIVSLTSMGKCPFAYIPSSQAERSCFECTILLR